MTKTLALIATALLLAACGGGESDAPQARATAQAPGAVTAAPAARPPSETEEAPAR